MCFYNIIGGSEAHLKAFLGNQEALDTVLQFVKQFNCTQLQFEAYDIFYLLFQVLEEANLTKDFVDSMPRVPQDLFTVIMQTLSEERPPPENLLNQVSFILEQLFAVNP